jgi:hypothetical protein
MITFVLGSDAVQPLRYTEAEDGDSTLLRNGGTCLRVPTASKTQRNITNYLDSFLMAATASIYRQATVFHFQFVLRLITQCSLHPIHTTSPLRLLVQSILHLTNISVELPMNKQTAEQVSEPSTNTFSYKRKAVRWLLSIWRYYTCTCYRYWQNRNGANSMVEKRTGYLTDSSTDRHTVRRQGLEWTQLAQNCPVEGFCDETAYLQSQ